jgi:hypothetical protein
MKKYSSILIVVGGAMLFALLVIWFYSYIHLKPNLF